MCLGVAEGDVDVTNDVLAGWGESRCRVGCKEARCASSLCGGERNAGSRRERAKSGKKVAG